MEKIKKIEINKKIHRLHFYVINKNIVCDGTKLIKCSDNNTIILRNCESNNIVRTFYHRNLLLLTNAKLASTSQDETIKIGNLTTGLCEQKLINHSDTIYCLLELPNWRLLT